MILTEQHDSVALLRLGHGKANALDVELCREMTELFRKLSEGLSRAVVLTGQGKIFSAGVDLLRLTAGGPGYVRTFLGELNGLCETVFSFPKPLVAALNGHAIAAGFVLACMADRRIMARGTGRVGLPELLVGVPFPPGPMEVLRFALPSDTLPRMMYSGATHEADPALDRGLVDEVVETGELLPHALRSAEALGALGEETFRLTKSQIRHPALKRMREAQREIGAEIEKAWSSPETLSRIAAYVKSTFKPGGR